MNSDLSLYMRVFGPDVYLAWTDRVGVFYVTGVARAGTDKECLYTFRRLMELPVMWENENRPGGRLGECGYLGRV